MHRVIIVALAAALLAIPMAASAGVPAAGTLKNNYGLQFAGQAKCISCHGVGYADTTHGKFSAAGVGGAPVPASGNIVSLGGATVASNSVFVTLGYGTGLRETLRTFGNGDFVFENADPTKNVTTSPQSYIAVIAGLENFWTVKAGGENVFDKWEYPNEGSEPEFEAYCGGNCHNLGYTKGAPNAAAGLSSTLTDSFVVQGWAAPWSGIDTSLQYDLRTLGTTDVMAGAGIQCENCHGTGVASDTGSHWSAGVKINSKGTTGVRPLLRSDVCGQCHGTYLKSNFLGYTPDKPLASFIATQVGAAQFPTEEQYAADVTSYTADPANYNKGTGTWGSLKYKQLWPRGINSGFMAEKADGSTYQAGMKHVYFTEWSLTKHSFRSKLTSISPDASMYQKSTAQNGLGGDNNLSNATTDYRDPKCGFCHAGEVYLKRKGDPMAAHISTDPADVGYLGVECASCHVVHNAPTLKDGAVGMGLRKAEVGNISICEDCHKERNTVMGVATNAPFAYDLSRSGAAGPGIGAAGAHAAEGTVLHGEGMVDVPNKIEGFMSSVGCEKCHMPATRADFPDVGLERYADRSFKRYTHSMQIVEPGQYGAVAWQDSCSPCHPGMSQAKLKSYIVDQQTVGAQLIAETSAAIVAADARVNYTGSTVPSANKALLDRAFNNYTFAQAERSGGFHNPGYTQAGLRKAVKMANSVGGKIAHIQASSSLAAGGVGYVAGTVENGLGAIAAGESVTLLRDGAVFGSTTSDENSNFSFMISGDVTHTYTAVWERCSDPIADLAAAVVVPVANPVTPPAPTKVATSLTLSISKNSAHLRSGYVLSGAISPRFAGASIVITYRRPGSRTWRTWTTVKTTASGTYSIGTRGYRLGTYTYRATFPGDATHGVARYVYHSIRIVR